MLLFKTSDLLELLPNFRQFFRNVFFFKETSALVTYYRGKGYHIQKEVTVFVCESCRAIISTFVEAVLLDVLPVS